MDKVLRNTLRLATVACRKALEADYASQLEGTFGIERSGDAVPEERLVHLTPRQREVRRQIDAAIEHWKSSGATAGAATTRFVREAAFFTLNRLAALKLMEAPQRALIQESIGAGAESRGFRQFKLLSPEALRPEPDGGYALYLDLVADDLAEEIGVLFDRDAPQAALAPSPSALTEVLARLNDPALADVWGEDETLGWIYQYFTPKEQRDEARKASAAPRDAYELAFRNQFFTPRYVVEFLTDNTLGRTWYEMRRGDTLIVDKCRYFVRRKRPIWLEPDEAPPEPFPQNVGCNARQLGLDSVSRSRYWTRPNPELSDIQDVWAYAATARHDGSLERFHEFTDLGSFANRRAREYQETGKWEGNFEDLRACLYFEQRRWRHYGWNPEGYELTAIVALNRAIGERWDLEVEVIPHRQQKDPRDLRILDPACGSGHFLLYAFELLLTIYTESYDRALIPELQRDYPNPADFLRILPMLILKHNLHRIDIDLRSVQIAQLALWLKAQRAYTDLEILASKRCSITDVNVVAPGPFGGTHKQLKQFLETIPEESVKRIVRKVWEGMEHADEIGSLFKADQLLEDAFAEVKNDFLTGRVFEQRTLFDTKAPPSHDPGTLPELTVRDFWQSARDRIRRELVRYAQSVAPTDHYQRKLFDHDRAMGFEYLDFFLHPFDVVLMNPPFGTVSLGARSYVDRCYPRTKNDLYAAFVERGLEVLVPHGYLGAITSRTGFFLTSFKGWREEIVLGGSRIHALADLGQGVLDTAMVETAAYVLEKR